LQIDVEIKDKKVQRLFTRLQRNVKDLRPAFRAIGEIVRSSVIRNFQEGGRPEKWEPTRIRSIYQAYTRKKTKSGANRKAYTIRGRLTKAFDRYSSGRKTLIDTARLQNSITARAETNRVVVGTDLVYARIHQLGGMAGRNRKVKIPARPYLLVQDEDWAPIGQCLRGFLMKGAQE
jgi:phage virion morphogenesis protein